MIRPLAETVATVAERRVPLAWVEARLETLLRGRLGRHLPPGESGETQRLRRWIVQELVARMVLLHEAERTGLWTWPAAPAGPDDVGAPELPDAVLTQIFDRVTAHVVVHDAEIDAYLARDPALGRRPEARRIRYVITRGPAPSPAWLAALQGGPVPDADGEVRHGEMWLRRGELVGPLEDALFVADIGAVVGPFELEHGWTAARLEAIAPATAAPTEAERAAVEAELLRHARARAFDAWLDGRRAAIAVIASVYEHPGHPIHGLPQHRH